MRLTHMAMHNTNNGGSEGRRGPVLEIDKNDDTYVPKNCVLSCYYCNNDKSYTSSKEDYKDYFGKNRHQYFKTLLDKLNNASLNH